MRAPYSRFFAAGVPSLVFDMRRIFFSIAALLFFALPSGAFAATLSVSPSFSSVSAGDAVSVNIVVSSADQAMNAVSGTLSFSSDILTLLSVSKAGSIVTIWATEPEFSNTSGTASFEGIVPNPGFTGSSGKVLTFSFRAKKAGTATLSFSSASVLANDGQGTEILGGTNGASVSVSSGSLPPAPAPAPVVAESSALTITSSTHPIQTNWYADDSPQFAWNLPAGALEVRTLVGENSLGEPSVRYAPAVSSKKVSNLPDGTFFFHLKVRTAAGWSETSRFRINIDTVAPKPFSVSVLPFDPQEGVQVTFSATDDLSGIDRYELLVNGVLKSTVDEERAREPVLVPPTAAGTSTLTVLAYDKAGNTTSSSVVYAAVGPSALFDVLAEPASQAYSFTFSIPYETLLSAGWTFVNYLSVLLIAAGIIGGILFAAWYVWHRVHTVRRTLLRRIASTDRVLHAELIEIHKVLKDEVERLQTEGKARELTSEEKRILKRFSKLVEKTKHAMAEEFSRGM